MPSPQAESYKGPAMVGSIHIYGDGYGYGIRYPTARNQQTKPSAVPQMRHPPLSERYLSGTRSTPLIRNDDRAHKRLADQMHMQTSGDYGKFLVDTDSKAVKLNSGKIPSQTIQRTCRPEPVTSQVQQYSARDVSERFQVTARPGVVPMDLTVNRSKADLFNNTRNSHTAGGTAKTQYTETLRSLDKQFDNASRRDLFAASLPTRRMESQEQLWSVTGNHRSSMLSKNWSDKLRPVATASSSIDNNRKY